MGILTNFIGTINTYGVRTQNQFAMRITFPNLLMRAMDALSDESSTSQNWHRISNELNNNLFCYGQGFDIPTRTINYADVSFRGYAIPVPTVAQFGTTHSITFNDDSTGSIRNILMRWQNASINTNISQGNFEGNRFTGDPSLGYGANIKIYLLSNEYDENAVKPSSFGLKGGRLGYELKGVTVAEIGATTLSNTASSVSTIPVSLRSQYNEPFEYSKSELEGLIGQRTDI